METFRDILAAIRDALETPLLTLGNSPVTVWAIFQLLVLIILLFYLSAKLRTWLVENFLPRTNMEIGARQATGSIIRYAIIAIGLAVIFQTAGIDLTALNVLAGAIGLGLGFGLQNIVNNFICGIVILFERPIKVGDRIVVGEVEGDVVHIGTRSTTVVSNDNISIIVPNSSFITENVVNWSHNDRKVRFRIPVSVAYGTDVALVERVLLEVAAANPDVLENPPPVVRLMEFGDSGLGFELRVWSTTLIHKRGLLTSSLNIAIYRIFKEHNIEIPYPRRNVQILSDPPAKSREEGEGSQHD
ncbi:MAG: mechanosensitive ion channel protein MscS [Deltaproteobacteria bacterium HGW-Deltaproteobacteria-4]|nr:MAG: mechanosensitive ion channel protein MscS [Deltaproteobacteria bacterium HGW-Deltaproteobacteria-4]